MPDLIPAKDGIVDQHPGDSEHWIPGQARNDVKEAQKINASISFHKRCGEHPCK